MATTKVSALAAKTSIAGSEELLINDGGTSKKVTATNLLAGVSVADGSISTAKIADDAVTEAKLANSINTDIATGVTANTTANAALPKSGGAMTGAITTNSTFDGRDVATDGTKLDAIEASADVTDATNVNAAGAVMESDYTTARSLLVQQSGSGSPEVLSVGTNTIVGRVTGEGSAIDDLSPTQVRSLLNVEDGADVTDTTNVTAAGALMDSEVTNLADVKAFDTTDYATAAQGSTADAALPKAGGTITGTVTVSANAVGTVTTDNDGSFSMSDTNNFKCTPTGNFTLTFTNIVAQSGNILLVNSGGHTVAAHANTKVDANLLATVSTAGTYLLSYFSDGTNVYMTNSAIYT
jgi:hypothetical protein